MFSTRWIKLFRDLQATPVRIVIMLLMIAVGVFSFTVMLSTYTVLSREISQNYLATNPASASLEVDNIDESLVAGARAFSGIKQAQASTAIDTDIYFSDGTLHPLQLFVVDDFNQIAINLFFANEGAWPPALNTLLLERSSLAQMKNKMGEGVSIRFANGSVHSLVVSGTVHDPAVPVPSMALFAYVSPETLNNLGVKTPLTELKITVRDQPFDEYAIEHTASQLAKWIEQQGHKVSRIKIPPPGEHPHQGLLFSVSSVFLLFSAIALTLSAILSAVLIDGLIAQQVRQIGIMKAIGASAIQIMCLYLAFILMVSVLATAIGVSVGLVAARAFSMMILQNLNFSLHGFALSNSIYFSLIVAGVFLPLVMAAIPIAKTIRISPQAALTQTGVTRLYRSDTKLNKWLYRISVVDRSVVMALRNSFRRRGRLMLMLTLLASSGAMFLSGINLKSAAQHYLVDAAAERHYDLEISLRAAEDQQKIRTILESIEGVDRVEAWGSTTLARHNADGFNIEKTFFDGAHGAIFLTAIPQDSSLLSIKMVQGNWLTAGDNEGDDKVVINRKAQEAFTLSHIGDEITIGAAGNAHRLKIIGIADQKMTSGMAYVSAATYKKITEQNEFYRNYRIVMKQHNELFVDKLAKKIEAALEDHQITLSRTITENRLRHEIDGHFTMLINALFFTSLLVAAVGFFSLGSAINTHVIERTREMGIMRSIGASSRIIVRNILMESVFIGFMSWVIAIVFSLPLSLTINAFLGDLIFDEPFPFAISLTALWVWLFVTVTGVLLASAYPAWRATHISIRESFA